MPKLRFTFLVASILYLSLLVGGFAGNVAQVQAQTANAVSLTAIPPRVGDNGEIKIKPGEKYQTTVRILNTSDVPLDVETFIQDFVIDADGKTPVPVRESVENRWSLASWVTATPSHQTIGAKKTVTISVLIDVPKDARPGGHYAMILHQPHQAGSTSGSKDQSSTGVNQEVGSLLYVNVAGPIDELAFIRGFAFKPNWAEFGPVQFSYSIDNQSDIHIKPTGAVTISDIFKRPVGQVEIESQNVFPGAQRAFVGTWPVKWGFGPYTATLNVAYGDRGQIATAQTVIWLLPISIIIAVLVAILSLITIVWFIKRRRNQPPGTTQPSSQPTQASADTTAPSTTEPLPPLV